MSFRDDVSRFAAKVDALSKQVHDGVCDLAFASIVEGSPVTGAPGQPVGQYGPGYHPGMVGGTLKASWQREILGPLTQRIVTNLVYAPNIEDGLGSHGPLTLRSTVGGFFSVRLTRASWDKIVATVVQQVAA